MRILWEYPFSIGIPEGHVLFVLALFEPTSYFLLLIYIQTYYNQGNTSVYFLLVIPWRWNPSIL